MTRVTVLTLATLSAVIFGVGTPAHAHQAPSGWQYPLHCCSNQDCKPASHVEVRETRAGYLVVATGELVPLTDSRVKDSPDGAFHLCQQRGDFDHGRVLCLFRPPNSF